MQLTNHSRAAQLGRATFGSFLALALAVAPAAADQHMEASAAPHSGAKAATENVKLTVRLGRLEGDTRRDVKSYDLIVISGGVSSRLLSGARMPIPTRRSAEESPSDADPGHVAYVYQNVGFSTEAHAWVLEDGRIKVVASIEDSYIEEMTEDEPPTVETRQLTFQVVLTPGVPVEVTRIEGIRDRSGFLEIEANVVK